MTVEETIAVIAPQLNGTDMAGAIELAEMTLSDNVCPEKRNMLIAYLAAHIMTLSSRGSGAASDISSISEGSLSISYANTTQTYAGDYGATNYGQRYLMLLRSCVFLPRTRGCV